MMRSSRSVIVTALLCLALLLGMPPAGAADDLARAMAMMQRSDFAAAIPLLRRLAEQEDADAQAYLGGLYLVGLGGLPHDISLAKQWLERAAGYGNATAAFNLGLLAERGEGGLVDFPGAVSWYQKSALGDFPMAMLKLGEAYRHGMGVPADPESATHWLRLAAEAGLPDAQNLFGVMIAEGETAGSTVEAYAWFKLAAGSGQPEAEENMNLLRTQMSEGEIAEGERRALSGHPARDR